MKNNMIVSSGLYPLPDRVVIRIGRKIIGENKIILRDYSYKDIYKGIDKHFQLEELLFENIYKNYNLIYPKGE
jgi:hypothetical protein